MKFLVGLSGIFLALAPALQAQVATEIPLGIEAVTGMRSNYVHRGFELAESSLDFQLEAEISLSNQSSAHFGLAHLAESNGDFSETTAYLELVHNWTKKLSGGASLTYRDRNASLLDSGFDLGFFTSYAINEDWRWRNEVNFDFGVGGTYLASELEWSKVISDDAFISIESGLSYVSSYLDRDGLNDFYTRIAFTYAISDQVAFTPFVGSSLQIADSSASDVLYTGFWFEVIF